MKVKKILGWTTVITIILGLLIVQTFTFMYVGELSFLFALVLAAIMLLAVVAVAVLVVFTIEQIIKRIVG